MIDTDREQQAVEAITAMNAAVQRLRLFPVSNPSTRDFITKAHDAVQRLTATQPFVLERTGAGYRVDDHPLSEKERRKTQVSSFLDLVFPEPVRRLTFNSDFDREGMTALMEILTEKPEVIDAAGGLPAMIAERAIAGVNIEMTGDREKGAAGDGGIDAAAIGPMLGILDDLLTGDRRTDVRRLMAEAIADRDDEVVDLFLTHGGGEGFAHELFEAIVGCLDDERHDRLLKRVKRLRETAGGSASESVERLYAALKRSERGRSALERINQTAQHHLKSALEAIARGETDPLADDAVLAALPTTVERFLVRENDKTAPALIDRMADALVSGDPAVRAKLAPVLADIANRLEKAERTEMLIRLSYKLAGWVRYETEMSPAFEQICIRLRDLAVSLLRSGEFAKCQHILKIFNAIHAGRIQKGERMAALVGEMIRGIGTDEIVAPLMEDLISANEDTRKQAMDRLVMLGEGVLDRLLGRLLESDSRTERSRILRVVCHTGQVALPRLEAEINNDAPWYYLRNLILLFGKVGTPSHLGVIRPFLEHDDVRVRRETLNSIYNIGGPESEEVVLAALPEMEDELKLNIVAMLGAWGTRAGVLPLLKLLESEDLVASKLRTELTERICHSLGQIGSKVAVEPLTDIVEQRKKGAIRGRAHGETLKAAAAKALEMIQEKDARESGGKGDGRRDEAASG
jgi:HEAT repeat protein